MNEIRFVNGSWFAYCEDRVLGPFKTRAEARRAIWEHQREVTNVAS